MPRPGLRLEDGAPSGSYFLVAAPFRLRFWVSITLEADTQAKAFGYHLVFPNHRQSFVDVVALRIYITNLG